MGKSTEQWPEGVKKTRQREQILSVLRASEKPMTASEILACAQKTGCSFQLSTVYRALAVFAEKGVVDKTNIIKNDTAVYELNRNRHRHYAVCIKCHKIIPMDNCPMEKFIPVLEEEDFQITGHNIEIYGVCSKCRIK